MISASHSFSELATNGGHGQHENGQFHRPPPPTHSSRPPPPRLSFLFKRINPPSSRLVVYQMRGEGGDLLISPAKESVTSTLPLFLYC